MTNAQNPFIYGEAVCYAGGEKLHEIQNGSITFGLKNIEAQKGDGGGQIVVPTNQLITGHVDFLGLTPASFALLTAATNSAGAKKRVRRTLKTKATNDITLTNTPITNTLEVIPSGSNKAPLVQVATSPALGEYSVSGTTVTLSASQTETDFYVAYVWLDTANGLTSKISPDALPDDFELYLTFRAKDLFPGTKGDMVIYAAKCTRTGELTIGAGNDAHATPGFDFSIRIDSADDFELGWLDT